MHIITTSPLLTTTLLKRKPKRNLSTTQQGSNEDYCLDKLLIHSGGTPNGKNRLLVEGRVVAIWGAGGGLLKPPKAALWDRRRRPFCGAGGGRFSRRQTLFLGQNISARILFVKYFRLTYFVEIFSS